MLVRHAAKNTLLPAAHGLGLVRLAAALRGGTRQVALNYHNVGAAVFERHARWLAENADVLPLAEFLARRGEPARRPRVTLTFDDGYASFASEVAPILARRRMPSAWFVPSSFVGAREPFWFDHAQAAIVASPRDRLTFQGRSWGLTSWNRAYVAVEAKQIVKRAGPERREALVAELISAAGEPPPAALDRVRIVSAEGLRALDPSLFEIGSHSRTHPQLSQISDAALDEELRGSKADIEALLGRPVLHFAYPSGDQDPRVVAAVRAAGYASAWTTEPRFTEAGDDPYLMPRVAIDDEAGVAVLAAKATISRGSRTGR